MYIHINYLVWLLVIVNVVILLLMDVGRSPPCLLSGAVSDTFGKIKVGQLKIHQRGVQWKQGVVMCVLLCTTLLCNTTPIHFTPLRLHPPLMNTHQREYPKSPSVKKYEMRSDPISADPTCSFPSILRRLYVRAYMAIHYSKAVTLVVLRLQ